jgi:LPXTG-motif cell wall-anchored protein
MTRRVIAAISAALLSFALVVVLPAAIPSTAPDAFGGVQTDVCGSDVLFVLDRSGSMDSQGINEVREGLTAFVASLGAGAAADSRVGIVDFASSASSPLGHTWSPVTGAGSAALDTYISTGYQAASSPTYYTNWEDAMEEAVAFTTGAGAADYVVVITDGQPTEFNDPQDPTNPNIPYGGAKPEQSNTMYEFASWEAVNEYQTLAPQIFGSDTIIGFGAGSDFNDGAATTRLGRIVDTVTVVSPLSALGEAIAALADEICQPSLDVEKSTNGSDADSPTGPAIAAGAAVNWTYTVTNTGPVSIYDIDVTDDNNDLATITCTGQTNGEIDLHPTDSIECSASSTSYWSTTHKAHSNTATAEGDSAHVADINDTDPSHYQPTLVCPYGSASGRIIIDIFDGDASDNGGFLAGAADRTPNNIVINGISVPAGTYDVMWASYDNHAVQGETDPGETGEVWRLNFGTEQTGSTSDIDWDDDYKSGAFASRVTFGSEQTSVTVEHRGAADTDNGVYAICAALDPIEAADITVEKSLASGQGDIYDGSAVTFDVTITNNSEDEAVTIDTLTEDLGNGTVNLLSDTGFVANNCDRNLNNAGDPNSFDIAADDDFECSFTIVIDAGASASHNDCSSGNIDVVAASGSGVDSGASVSDDDCAEITVEGDPTIVVTKTVTDPADGSVYESGQNVTFHVTIENESDTEAVTIDELYDNIGGSNLNLLAQAGFVSNDCDSDLDNAGDPASFDIAAEDTFECDFVLFIDKDTTSHATTDECENSSARIDVVTAAGEGEDSGLDVSDDDCAEITVDPDPMITLLKEVVAPVGPTAPEGGNVTYRVTIENESTTESVTITSLIDDVDGETYDLLAANEDDFVDNSCNDTTPLTIAADSSVSCTFTLFVSHETASAAGTHDGCAPDSQVIDIVTASGVGDTSEIATNEPSACAEVRVDEPDASLAIDKLVWDPTDGKYVNEVFLPSSTVFPTTVEWKITLSNPSDDTVTNIVFTDVNAPACVTAFDAAMDAVETDKDWLVAGESVTFTCEDSASLPFINTAVANGDDVWDRPVQEVSDVAAVSQVQASAIIGDTVWYDCAKTDTTDPTCDNGVQDAGELGIAGAKVTIVGLDGQDVDPDTTGIQTSKNLLTDVNGKYLFSGLPPGNYNVKVLIGDVPDAQDRTLRFTTASSYTILLPEGGQRLDADFGVIADTLPETGISADEILVIAILLLVVGSVAVVSTRRKEDEAGTELAA